jgi:hypothetical protein
MALDPDTRADFLANFPYYEHVCDEYGQKRVTTDDELERLYEIEDEALWAQFELAHPVLAAWVTHVDAMNEDLGETRRLRLANIVCLSFYLGTRE